MRALIGVWLIIATTACAPERLDVTSIERSVARIFCTQGGSLSIGSGFVVEPGLLVTNAHVVEAMGTPCSRIEVAFSATQRFDAELVVMDARRDLALLRVKGDTPPALTLATGDAAKSLELFVIGFPGDADPTITDINRYVPPSLSNGVVSRQVEDENSVMTIQTNAQMNPGNSGGPVFDRCGRVVGVATRVKRGIVEGLNWAVHAREIASFLTNQGQSLSTATKPCKVTPGPLISTSELAFAAGAVVILGTLLAVGRGRRRAAGSTKHAATNHGLPTDRDPAALRPSGPWAVRAEAAPPRYLRVVDGPLRGTQHAIAHGCTIGRDPAIATLCVPVQTEGISRRHVELRVRARQVEVKDCWSSAGSSLNGRALVAGEWTVVPSGAHLSLGDNIMTIAIE